VEEVDGEHASGLGGAGTDANWCRCAGLVPVGWGGVGGSGGSSRRRRDGRS
jgi:hypothetical protein